MERLPELLTTNQAWLVERIIHYAKQFGYTKYTAPLAEAWQALVGGISAALSLASRTSLEIPELDPDQDLSQDPMAQFAVLEAQRHRERGVDLGMFLGFLVYIRQAYLDLLIEQDLEPASREHCHRFVERCFDRFSIGVSVEWAAQDERAHLGEMQAAQRWLVAEKNKYMTIFQGLPHAVLVLDEGLALDSLNQVALALLDKDLAAVVGCGCPLGERPLGPSEQALDASQPARPALREMLPWLAGPVGEFVASGREQDRLLAACGQEGQARHFQVSLRRLPDESGQPAGVVVVLEDVSEREQAALALRDAEERFAKAFYASPAGMSLSTLEEGRFLAINRAFAKITGLALEDILGRTALELGLWSNQDRRRERLNTLREGGKISSQHTRFKDKKGRNRTVLWSAEILRVQEQPCLLTVMVDLTELQEVADQLQQERNLLQAILDTSPVGITVSDEEGLVSFFNRKAWEIMGWGEAKVAPSGGVHVPWLANNMPMEDQASLSDQTRVLGGAKPLLNQSYLLTLASGEQRTLSLSVAPLFEATGQLSGLVSTVEDISLRVQAEQTRQALERNLRVQSACYAQLIHCQEEDELLKQVCQVIVELGDYALAWVGVAQQDAAKSVKPVAWYGPHGGYAQKIQVSWGDGPLGQGPIGRAMRSGKPEICQDVHGDPSMQPWRENYEKHGFQSSIALPLLSDGNAIGALVVYCIYKDRFDEGSILLLQEVADNLGYGLGRLRLRKELDLALQEVAQGKATLEAILDAAPVSIALVKDRVVVWANRATQSVFGYTAEEMVGHSTRMTYASEEDFQKTGMALYPELAAKGAAVAEVEIRTKQGQTKPVEISVRNLDPANPSLGHIALARDLSEIRKAESDKASLEGQIRQTQKMEALGTLAGGIAHDFNNILSAILGFTQLAMDHLPAQDMLRNYLEQVLQAGERASALVKQILAFSRKVDQEKRPIDLGPVVKETVKMLRASLPANIEIRQNLQPNSGTVMADSTQIYQVLMNLCTNASHAMKDKGGVLAIDMQALTVSADKPEEETRDLSPGSYLCISVSDTGHGMGPDVLPRIFDPFFTTKDRGEGTGLGLAVAHGIVTSHQGVIKVKSEVGVGSCFKVFLPTIALAPSGMIDSMTALPTGHGRILFVDDEKLLVELYTLTLERLGYQVVSAQDGQAALDLFRGDPQGFDLVITDFSMPVMNGLEMAREMLKLRPQLPIILTTGYQLEINPDDLPSLGIKGYLPKPLVRKNMVELVAKMLDRDN
ncbi:MAG: PAS domain S-box protein [Desulfarculus sp.]|nr:PAS domain S-box protein [Desulfarculus sp.]